MSDPADLVDGVTDSIAAGVEVTFEPVGGAKTDLRAEYDGQILASGEYAEVFRGSHRGRTNRGEFINNVSDSLKEIAGIDPDQVKTALRNWFDEMAKVAEEEEMAFQPEHVREIVEGTQTPVDIHGGEETTWRVTLTYAGRTTDLDFTAAEMVGSGGASLEEKLANYYYEIVEIEPEDWKTIRDYWQDHSEEASFVEETGRDAVAGRFLDRLTDGVRPLESLEQVATDPSGAWYDENNSAGYGDAPADASILWVQSRFYGDKLEAIGKQIEYRGQLTKDLIARDALYGSSVRRTWDGNFDRLTALFPFDPEELGIDPDDVAPAPGDNTDEVEP